MPKTEFIHAITNFMQSYSLLNDILRNIRLEDTNVFSEDINDMLIQLISMRVNQLQAFELLLKSSPEKAIKTIKHYYLSIDLSHSAQDLVADLDIMFSDIKEILDEKTLDHLLTCPEFLEVNKTNNRVKEAIDFAYDRD